MEPEPVALHQKSDNRVNHLVFFFFQVFDGNSDRHTIVYHQFIKPFTAVNVRIYPKSWYGWICLRAEFYGCAGRQM